MTTPHIQAARCSTAVKSAAAQLAFDACGIAAAGPVDPEDRLGAWLDRGFHAGMDWLARTKDVRQDIRRKLPGAKSVVVVARNYYSQPLNAGAASVLPGRTGRIARYAWGRDYHQVLAKPLRTLADQIQQMGEGVRCYCSIDTGPVMEKAWAQRAGIGWIGKNGLVLRHDLGSWFFLGLIATTLDLVPDAPAENQCGACTRCIDACPTRALVEPSVLDARRCLSYLTIEHRGPIPDQFASQLGDNLFGCDACQDACPYNQNPPNTTEQAFRPIHPAIDLDDLIAMEEKTFTQNFVNTPITRATLPRLKLVADRLRQNSVPRLLRSSPTSPK